MRRMTRPPSRFAISQDMRAAKTFPACMRPLGDGAMRATGEGIFGDVTAALPPRGIPPGAFLSDVSGSVMGVSYTKSWEMQGEKTS